MTVNGTDVPDDEDQTIPSMLIIIDVLHRDDVLERISAVLVNGPINSFSLWSCAWQDMMGAYGYPRARLYPIYQHEHLDDEGQTKVYTVTYGWEADQDMYINAVLTGTHYHPSDASWLSAHHAFVDVDKLRPDYVQPSEKLAEWLDNQEMIDDANP